MGVDLATETIREALKTMLMLVGPVLFVALIVGLAISILQAVTQIHEMTLTFVPKILLVIVCLFFLLPWMLNVLTAFTVELIGKIPQYVR
jgi:flagellar biosynthetic protein FliQ